MVHFLCPIPITNRSWCAYKDSIVHFNFYIYGQMKQWFCPTIQVGKELKGDLFQKWAGGTVYLTKSILSLTKFTTNKKKMKKKFFSIKPILTNGKKKKESAFN